MWGAVSEAITRWVCDHGPPWASAKAVLHTISAHIADGAESCGVSIMRLAKEAGVSRATVYRVIEFLRENGFMRILRGGGRGVVNRYFPNLARRQDDPPPVPAPEPTHAKITEILETAEASGKMDPWFFRRFVWDQEWNAGEIRRWSTELGHDHATIMVVVQDVLSRKVIRDEPSHKKDDLIRSMLYFRPAMWKAAWHGPPTEAAARGADPPRGPPPGPRAATREPADHDRARETQSITRSLGRGMRMLGSTAIAGGPAPAAAMPSRVRDPLKGLGPDHPLVQERERERAEQRRLTEEFERRFSTGSGGE